MNILALDLGTHCGWATWDGRHRDSGVEHFDLKRGDSQGMRFVRFNAWLIEKFNQMYLSAPPTGIDMVIYEQTLPMHRSAMAAEIAHGLSTRVQEECAKRNVAHSTVHGSTLKKWTTGSGRAKKPEMVRAVHDAYVCQMAPGQVCRHTVDMDDNEADAIAIVEWAKRKYGQ